MSSKKTGAKYWIEKLRLEPHPEGGYFRQTYKAEVRIVPEAWPGLTRADRSASQNPHTKIAKGAILEWGTQGTILESGTQGLGGTRGLRDTQRVGGTPGVGGARAASTGIYFLLEGENFSAFHRLRSDEMWHFYAGSPLAVHVIDEAGEYSSIFLGDDPEAGQVFQAVVKAGCWFASGIARNPHLRQNQPEVEIAGNPHLWQNRPEVGHPMWALVGCTVAPGFEFEDFELAKRKELVRRFPRHRELIERLTRQ